MCDVAKCRAVGNKYSLCGSPVHCRQCGAAQCQLAVAGARVSLCHLTGNNKISLHATFNNISLIKHHLSKLYHMERQPLCSGDSYSGDVFIKYQHRIVQASEHKI